MACALIHGTYGIADMDLSQLTPDIMDLIHKTKLIPDTAMEDRIRGIRGTRIEVVLKDGKRVEETVLVPKGDPENPITREEIIQKLRSCAEGRADENILMKLVDGILSIKGESIFDNPMTIVGAST